MAEEKQEAKKYYWLKLHKDFFTRHDIRVIEAMPNGKDYVLFYLKLLTESISYKGELRFSETIPYNEEMLSTITNTNIDIVRSAMKIFRQLELVSILDDMTIYLQETQKMLGVETEWAKKKRDYRERKSLENDGQADNGRTKKDNVRQEIEIEKELDIELEIYKDTKDMSVSNETNDIDTSDADVTDDANPPEKPFFYTYKENDINHPFNLFWEQYPRKVKKKDCLKKFQRKIKDIKTFQIMYRDVLLRCDTPEWTDDGGKYIPHPTTYLNQELWKDGKFD